MNVRLCVASLAAVQLPASTWSAAAPKSPMPELGWAGVLPFTWR